jgi:hypothetical protein
MPTASTVGSPGPGSGGHVFLGTILGSLLDVKSMNAKSCANADTAVSNPDKGDGAGTRVRLVFVEPLSWDVVSYLKSNYLLDRTSWSNL